MTTRIIAGRYEIGKSLGRGGFSEVFLAHDRNLDRDVALKQLFGSTSDESFCKQREREKKIYSQLRSKHVVQLFDQFEWEGSYYLVFESMDHSMERYKDPVAIETVLHWMQGFLAGLRDIHACKVIHRDIKPSNLFIDAQGEVRIGDFGAAAAEAGSVSLAGWTPQYMAPELIEGEEHSITPNSDLYSLGFVVYRLVLGEVGMRQAFPDIYKEGLSAEAIKNRWMLWHEDAERKAPLLRQLMSDVSQEFSDWLLKMVQKDSRTRYQSSEETLSALRTVIEPAPASGPSAPITVQPSSSPPPPPVSDDEPRRKSKLRTWAVVSILAIAAIIVILLLKPGSSDRKPGLYMSRADRGGTFVTADMIEVVGGKLERGEDYPTSFAQIRGAALYHDVGSGHRLEWSDLMVPKK